jgi:hypothetical protein
MTKELRHENLNAAVVLAHPAAHSMGPLVDHFPVLGRHNGRLVGDPPEAGLRLIGGRL